MTDAERHQRLVAIVADAIRYNADTYADSYHNRVIPFNDASISALANAIVMELAIRLGALKNG